MCPVCLTTLAWLAIGTTSAGSGTLVMVMNRLRRVDNHDDEHPAIAVKKETAP
jgi:hypothetical protein